MSELPVVVVGAGPIGLAAAAHLREGGLEPLVLERGTSAGAAITQWHSVHTFSRWAELIDPAARVSSTPPAGAPPASTPTPPARTGPAGT